MGSSRFGGMEEFFVSFCRAMRRANVTVRAVIRKDSIPSYANDLTAAGIDYDTLIFEPLLNPWSRYRLRRIADSFKPDVALTFASRASACMPKGDYAILGRLGGYYAINAYKRCDHLVCNAPDIVRHVVEEGWPSGRVSLIPNFPRIDDGPPIDRAMFDTPDAAPLALALGRLHRKKAFDVLLRAAADIPGLWVWIAGEGEERNRLVALAKALGIWERVRFLGWQRNRAGLFGAADICVYPSRHEPFGNVVLEAWAYRTPLIAANASGPAWLIRDGADGLVFPVDDAEKLAEAIEAAISSNALRDRLVENGSIRLREDFSEGAVVAQYLDLMERLIANRRS
jgi:glycosyltransferase involved in cell wall biosynthesis